jgi:hypothetical protein
MIYAEMLHSTFDFKSILAYYFENFTTDKYSIFYSHFTVEESSFGNVVVKFYFYDGIVEQKVEFLLQYIRDYGKRKKRTHTRILKRFTFIENRFIKVNVLHM